MLPLVKPATGSFYSAESTAPTAHLVIKLSKCDATSRKTCHRQLLLGRVNCANRPLLDFIKVFDFEMRYHPLANRHLVCLFGRVPTAHLFVNNSIKNKLSKILSLFFTYFAKMGHQTTYSIAHFYKSIGLTCFFFRNKFV